MSEGIELIEAMDVRQTTRYDGGAVITGHDPEFSENWTEAQQLAWLLGCLRADYGITGLYVYNSHQKINGKPARCTYWGVGGPGWSETGRLIEDMWTYLHGLSRGYLMATRTSGWGQ